SWPRTLSQFWAPDWRSSTSSWIPCWKVPRRSEVASGWARMLRPTGVSTHAGPVSTEALGLGLEVVAEVAGEAPWVFPDPPEQAARKRVMAAREAPDAILIIRLTLRGFPFERSNTLGRHPSRWSRDTYAVEDAEGLAPGCRQAHHRPRSRRLLRGWYPPPRHRAQPPSRRAGFAHRRPRRSGVPGGA